MADYKKPTAEKGQKGQFVGDPSKTHIHIVKANTHVTVAGKRKDFDPAKPKTVQTAIEHLQEKGTAGTPGYNNCLAYLQGL